MAIATQTNCNGILLDQFKCIFDPSGPENGQILAKIVRNLAKISKNHIFMAPQVIDIHPQLTLMAINS